MAKNIILIANNSLVNKASHTSDTIDQGFLETYIHQEYAELQPVRVDGYRGVGQFLSNEVPVRFDEHPPARVEDLHTLGENSILNNVKAIVFPIDHGDENTLWHTLYNSEINHVSSLLQKEYGIDAKLHSEEQAFYNLKKNFQKIFDISSFFEAHKFLPNYRESGPQDVAFATMSKTKWTPVVEAGYKVWLKELQNYA